MPLIQSKSKKAFEKNLKTEIHEGKPMNQSLAIAYATKRKAPKKKMSLGGEVQDDVNKVNERDPIDHDSESDSTQFGPSKERKGSNLPLNVKTQQEESVFEPDDDEHAMADSEHFAEGGSIPEPELKNVNARSSLGSHVEMLVDKMLKMKMGNAEAEHFSDGGDIQPNQKEKIESFQKGFGYEPKESPSPGPSPDYQRPKGGDAYDRAHDKLMNDLDHQYGPSKGYSYGGKIEQMVNACIDKKMMAEGGIIPEKSRAHNSPEDQSAEGPDDESNHMDDDILSEDDYMNENMDHEDSMEPNKNKKLMASILADVRKHNMGK